jgi:ankyrin repeat protein
MADEFLRLIRAVVAGDAVQVRQRLVSDPALATSSAHAGATRGEAKPYFFASIRHYLYEGDTALHLAAAAYQREIAEVLVTRGASVHARNRLTLQPLHLAATTNHWNPDAQAKTIAYLLSAGADPNASDRLGVTPLHRAVRTRSAGAVTALIVGGADPRKKNRSGSTPLHLAVQTTGRGGSGSPHARTEQAEIIRLLLDAGAEA